MTVSGYEYQTVSAAAALFIGLVGAFLAVGIGGLVVCRLCTDLPKPTKWGMFGAVGFGLVGTVTFFVGVGGGFRPSVLWAGAVLWALLGVWGLTRNWRLLDPFDGVRRSAERRDPIISFLIFVTCVLLLLRLPSVITPSAGADWDSTSHQLAMVKIWLQDGRLSYIPWMNHSNIPALVNMLYVWGLEFGGQACAKVFAYAFAVFAVLSIGGLAAQRFGTRAGAVAALAFVSTPVALWEPGTAYVDVAHGLYAGGALLFSAMYLEDLDRRWVYMSGVLLGFALASKYTGFQVAVGIAFGMLLVGAVSGQFGKAIKGLGLISLISAVIACPWYIRNVVNTGNPVYPFFYGVFGGKDWSARNAEIYAAEQKRFGIGQTEQGKNPLAIPGSITALATMSHTHINGGAIWGAVGPVFVLGLLLWPISGRMRREEASIVIMILATLITWFYLTQQSRYIISLVFAGAFLVAGVVARLQYGWLASVALSLQTAWTLFWFGGVYTPLFPGSSSEIMQALNFAISGKSDSAYLAGKEDFGGGPMRRLPFWEATDYINNNLGKNSKVALIDEVRGFYLDVPYYWANPGFSTMIPWEQIQSPDELIAVMKRLGTTHIYLNLDPSLTGDQTESAQLRYAFFPEYFALPLGEDAVSSFRRLILDAYRAGLVRKVGGFDTPEPGLFEPRHPPMAVLLEIPR